MGYYCRLRLPILSSRGKGGQPVVATLMHISSTKVISSTRCIPVVQRGPTYLYAPPPVSIPHSVTPAFLHQTPGDGEKRKQQAAAGDEWCNKRIDSRGGGALSTRNNSQGKGKEMRLAGKGGRATMESDSLSALHGQGGEVVDVPQALLG